MCLCVRSVRLCVCVLSALCVGLQHMPCACAPHLGIPSNPSPTPDGHQSNVGLPNTGEAMSIMLKVMDNVSSVAEGSQILVNQGAADAVRCEPSLTLPLCCPLVYALCLAVSTACVLSPHARVGGFLWLYHQRTRPTPHSPTCLVSLAPLPLYLCRS